MDPVRGSRIIAVDIAIIWAPTAHGRDIQKMSKLTEMGMG